MDTFRFAGTPNTVRTPTFMQSHGIGGSAYLWARKVVIGFALFIALLLVSPAASFLRLLFPAAAVAIGIYVYRQSKEQYVSFLCWIWFLSPFIRRVVDYRAGGDAATILLTPYLLTAIPAFVIAYHWPTLLVRRLAPLLLMLAATLYGTFIGLTNFSALVVFQALVVWLAPLCFAFFLYHERSRIQGLFISFESAMIKATAVTALYGIYQYFVMPAWDAHWMRVLGNVTFGEPEPMQARVFSTLNAPQIFALFLTMGIIFAIQSNSRWKFVAVPAGLIALTLTMARTGWIGFLVGIAYLFFRLSSRLRLQLVVIAFCSLLAFSATLADPRVNESVTKRFNTLGDVNHDLSWISRVEGTQTLLESFGESPFGLGLGSQQTGTSVGAAFGRGGGAIVEQNDSTLAALIVSLGAFGTALAFLSLIAIGVEVVRSKRSNNRDSIALKAMLLALAAEFLVNDIINGPAAFILWSSVGFSLMYGGDRVLRRVTPEVANPSPIR